MESIRSMFGVSIAQLMVLSAMVPACVDVNESDDDHRRLHSRRHSQSVSHSRDDYPVIYNWLTSPDTPVDSQQTS